MFCFILTHWHLFEVEAHVEFTFLVLQIRPYRLPKSLYPQTLEGEFWRPCLAFIIEYLFLFIFLLVRHIRQVFGQKNAPSTCAIIDRFAKYSSITRAPYNLEIFFFYPKLSSLGNFSVLSFVIFISLELSQISSATSSGEIKLLLLF